MFLSINYNHKQDSKMCNVPYKHHTISIYWQLMLDINTLTDLRETCCMDWLTQSMFCCQLHCTTRYHDCISQLKANWNACHTVCCSFKEGGHLKVCPVTQLQQFIIVRLCYLCSQVFWNKAEAFLKQNCKKKKKFQVPNFFQVPASQIWWFPAFLQCKLNIFGFGQDKTFEEIILGSETLPNYPHFVLLFWTFNRLNN